MNVQVATYNIHYGIGLDGQYDIDRILAAVSDADIILLQEVTRGYIGNGGVDMVEQICERLPDRFVAFDAASDSDAGSMIADGVAVNQRFQFGNMIISRWPLTSIRRHLLPRRLRTNRLDLQRGALEALVITPAGPIRFYSVHLDHIDQDERLAQIEILRKIAVSAGETGLAVTGLGEYGFSDPPLTDHFVVGGDFNFEPDSIDHAVMTGADGAVSEISPKGFSFYDPSEEKQRQRLDYLFANPVLASRCIDGRIDEANEASDHKPVWVTISA